MEARRHSIDLDRGTVSYLAWDGRRDHEHGRAVVLLHGGGLDNAQLSWSDLGPALAARGHRVLAPDHPGYGESPDAPWPNTQQNLITYVGAFIDAVGAHRPVLGGLSLGGGLTLGLALQRPGAFAGLIAFASYGLATRTTPGPAGALGHLAQWALVRAGLMGPIMRWSADDRGRLEWSLRHGTLNNPDAVTPALVDDVVAATRRDDAFGAFEQFQRSEFGPLRLRTSYLDRLGEIDAPTLFVHGTRDAGVPIESARRAALATPRGRLLAVEGAAHWVQRDRPDVVTPQVLAFVDSLG